MSEPINIDSQGNIVLKVNWKITLKVIIILTLSLGSWFLPLPGLTIASKICLMLFIGAAGLWITEAIPPFATAILVIVLSVFTLGIPGGPLDLESSGINDSYQIFINPMASPVLVLFFGGFILAMAASKHGLDVRLAKAFIKPFGTHPKMVLLGVISITALFSMFMSNTATTAMMIAILAPLFKHFEGRDAFRKALALAVPFAANIGGIGTMIGTPPNAVAASILNELGYPISFFTWMLIGVPIAAVLLLCLWLLLIKVFKPRTDHFEIIFPEELAITWDLVIVVCTFTVTIVLWLTQPLHGIPTAVVALIPVMIFAMFGIIDRNDLKKIDWDILILVAGGLTLGVAMTKSGLSNVLVGKLSILDLSPLLLLSVIAIFTIVISNFMSNTSASNLLIPIATSLAIISPTLGALTVALAASMAMSLPVSTPPNAIAFATQEITTGEMARYGTIMSLIGMVVLIIALYILKALL